MKIMQSVEDWGMTDEEGFLKGIKPALYISSKISKRYNEYEGLYPSVPDPREEPIESYIFFQTQSLKDQFLDELRKIKMDSLEFDRLLGQILGFPPNAIEYYIKPYGADHERIFHHYAGLHFVGHIKDLIVNARWVWDNYPNIGTFKFHHDLELFEVEYQDFEGLERERNKLIQITKESLSPAG